MFSRNELEIKLVINEVQKVSKIDYRPNFIYDTWAITSFCNEFDKKIFR